MACGAAVGACFSIYFQYCYLMVPYILAENPDMKAREALRLSKEMMDGQKWNAFVLGLSFIGWQLLGTLLCGIGTFFVQPYVDATFAELYAVLRGPYSGRLNGFGGEPFVQNNARYGGQYVEPDSVRVSVKENTVVMVSMEMEMDRTRTALRTAGVMCRRRHISTTDRSRPSIRLFQGRPLQMTAERM